MKVVLLIGGRKFKLTTSEGSPTAEASIECPHCKAKPLRVSGSGRTIGGHDYYKADGFCANAECAKYVGEIRAYVSTIFGLEEDERVLIHGRARVY